MRTALVLALALGGCVDGLAPMELGVGRRVGMYPGDVSAVLPPMTDRAGNLYVVTGMPDSSGSPQPGTAHTGGARGGWSEGCSTGSGAHGGARGWIGATDGRGWLWTKTAIIELDVPSGTCTTKLDTDPVSASDVVIVAAAPLVDEGVSGRFALAIVTTGAEPTPHLATIDLDLGIMRTSTALPGAEVFATGADVERNEAAFLIRDENGLRVLLARAHDGITSTIAVSGTLPAPGKEVGEIAFSSDGSIAAVLGVDTLALGTRAGLGITTAPMTLRTIERDDEGQLWLAGADAAGAKVAPVAGGLAGRPLAWTCATEIDRLLAEGILVIDDRAGQRTASRWHAHAAYGASALLPMRSAPPYAVGARAVLVADPAVERGGIPYSQLAVIPVGVEFP